MKRQLRVLIGDIGDVYAESIASALAMTGDWAIARPQQRDIIMSAIREGHPDVLILNLSAPTMPFPEVTAELLQHTELIIIALYHTKNIGLAQIFKQQGVLYMPFPETHDEFVKYVHRITGQKHCSRIAASEQTNPELVVTRLLHSFSIPINLCGFHYLRYAILYAYEQNTPGGCMMSTIYPAVAEAMHSTTSRVERSIRNAIMQGWENVVYRGARPSGICDSRRMTNSEFIAFAVDRLRTECAEHKSVSD